MPTWSKEWDALSVPHRTQLKAYLNDVTRTAISDLELRAVIWLRDHEMVEGQDFHWQHKINRFTVDIFRHQEQQVIELYGCGYHQCPTCFPKPWWPGVIQKDQQRQLQIELSGYSFTVIWNHENVEARLNELLEVSS